ncbi:transglutaminase domain-containing protein [Rhodopirellula maiorica SM1]|uniref:Transglutaminase domain-containing protein n=1 Tax=Rhodopirellula maiorica SM1 TaxID=1265738 RepID=M5S1E6_9BACT|nr:transglutaminase domain-containing protein [Rhodopirellula maiorica SM1]
MLQIAAATTAHQNVVSEELTFDPKLSVEQYRIGDGCNRLHRIVVDPCKLSVKYRATVELSPEVDPSTEVNESNVSEMPPDVLTYLNPSRYCESDLLLRFAFEEFGTLDRGFGRVQAVCDWVNHHLDYTPGSTNATTTAADVLVQRTGVCRDYAHLTIALCRGIGIPARYVAGYAVDLQPPDFHGFVEAYLGGQWYLFDPTGLAPIRGLVRIGVGRDAADVSIATITGNTNLTSQNVWANTAADVQKSPNAEQPPAVSTA